MPATAALEAEPSGGTAPARRERPAAWGAWAAVVFALFSAGAPHEVSRAFDDAHSRGTLRITPANALDAARAYLTNDGDAARYLAYCDASLGRPYRSWYVRAPGEWQSAFASAPGDPDAAPVRIPPGPLRPYRDFLVEYPPGFFLWAMPPALLARTVDGYRLLFSAFMAAALTAALLLALRLVRLLPFQPRRDAIVLASAAGAFLVGTVATHRYDAVVSLMLAAAAWAAFRERPVWLGAAVGLGVASKLVPLAAAPVWALLLLRRRRFGVLAAAAAVAAAVGGGLLLAPLLWGGSLAPTAAYHQARPLQLESSAAAVLGIGRALGAWPLDVVQSYGSSNVVGSAAEAALWATGPLTAAALAVAYLWAFRRIRGAASPEAARLAALEGAAAALVATMVLGKVLSPQYLVWLLPLGVLLAMGRGGASPWLLGAALALTQIIYPASYSALQELRPWACALVLLRNGLLVAWVWNPGRR